MFSKIPNIMCIECVLKNSKYVDWVTKYVFEEFQILCGLGG